MLELLMGGAVLILAAFKVYDSRKMRKHLKEFDSLRTKVNWWSGELRFLKDKVDKLDEKSYANKADLSELSDEVFSLKSVTTQLGKDVEGLLNKGKKKTTSNSKTKTQAKKKSTPKKSTKTKSKG